MRERAGAVADAGAESSLFQTGRGRGRGAHGPFAQHADESFELPYDHLVLACGTETNTFGTPGVAHGENNVYFLKQLEHARAIRNRLIECFERAASPGVSDAEKDRLLSFCVVGGGPISVEFAGELHDFITRDVAMWYPELIRRVRVTLIEAGDHLLGAFDARLVAYVESLMRRKKFDVRTGVAVKAVHPHRVELSDGSEMPCGIVIWSTGVAPVPFMAALREKGEMRWEHGRVLMDDRMRLLDGSGADASGAADGTVDGVYGLGDCAASYTKPLPTLGGVARLQANYLAERLNGGGSAEDAPPFKYVSLLQMSSVGADDALLDPTVSPLGKSAPVINGLLGKLLWASAYWGFQVSTLNKILIPMFWFKSAVFGRDISRF